MKITQFVISGEKALERFYNDFHLENYTLGEKPTKEIS